MATIAFAPSAAPATETPKVEVPATAEIAVIEPKPLITSNVINPPTGIEGEITADDIKPPRLNLVQKVGTLPDKFSPGSFVYDKEFEIIPPKGQGYVTVLRLKKYYQQKLTFGTDDLPVRLDTAQQVREAGGTTEWSDEAIKEKRYYSESADVLLAIESMPHIDADTIATYFPYSIEGTNFGLLAFTVTSSAFTRFGKRIITDASLLLRDGLWNGRYKLTADKVSNASNSWFVPAISFDKKHSPETAAFLRSIAGL